MRLRVDIAILDFPPGDGGSQAFQEVILSVNSLGHSSLVASEITNQLHDVGVSSRAVTYVVKRPAFNGHVVRTDPPSAGSGILSSLKLAQSLLHIASVVAPIVEVYVGVTSGPIHTVVRFFSSELDRAGLHAIKL